MPSLPGKSNPSYKHGHGSKRKESKLYLRHRNMIIRCHTSSAKDYPKYGARGITVCDRWRFGENGMSGFQCFLSDMGEIPFDGASLDRIDGKRGYSPDNCRWATVEEQANNKKTSKYLEIDGVSLSVKQWSRVSGVGDKTILYRLKKGVPPRQAVFDKPDRSKTLGERNATVNQSSVQADLGKRDG